MTQPLHTAQRIAPGTRVGASPPPWGRVGGDPDFQSGNFLEQSKAVPAPAGQAPAGMLSEVSR